MHKKMQKMFSIYWEGDRVSEVVAAEDAEVLDLRLVRGDFH